MWYLSSDIVCCICRVQPPQQVALTESESQVNAHVGPIPQTCSAHELLCSPLLLLCRLLCGVSVAVECLAQIDLPVN